MVHKRAAERYDVWTWRFVGLCDAVSQRSPACFRVRGHHPARAHVKLVHARGVARVRVRACVLGVGPAVFAFRIGCARMLAGAVAA